MVHETFKINYDYVKQDNLSEEFFLVYEEIDRMFKEFPINEISPMYFLAASASFDNSFMDFLYYANEDSVADMILDLIEFVNNCKVRVIKPGRVINLSEAIVRSVTDASEKCASSGVKVYISAILGDLYRNDESVREFFSKHGMTDSLAEEFNEMYMNGHIPDRKEDGDGHMQVKLEIKNPPKNFNLGDFINAQQQMGMPQIQVEDTSSFCTDMIYNTFDGKVEDVFGRDDVITKITETLMRKNNRNVVVVGDSGVGKTSIIDGLAYRIAKADCNPIFYDYHVFKLNTDAIMSGTALRGMMEARVLKVVENLSSLNGHVLLLIDDFHHMLTDKNFEEFNVPFLLSNITDSDKINVVMTMTQFGYKSFSEKCTNAVRRFSKVTVTRPSYEECVSILGTAKKKFEKHHNVVYTEKAVSEAIKLSERYIQERSLPSSAIDILDEAGAKKHAESLVGEDLSVKLKEMSALYETFMSRVKRAKSKDDVEPMRGEIHSKHTEMENAIKNAGRVCKTVTEQDIYQVFSKLTGIEYNDISSTEMEKVMNLSENIRKRVIGQDEAIEKISNAVKRRKAGLVRDNKPILTCMCIGSTGVGKTLLAKTLAKEMFGDESKIVRFDMSEYSDKTSVNKLIGTSAGYIGYNNGGLLTEAVKNNKYCVLLIDEIEKADSDVYNIFLQIFDEGFMTDNRGSRVDFKNTIILMTSNVGVSSAMNTGCVGFDTDRSSNKRALIEKAYKKKFPPEFINRLDETIYFNDLTDDNMRTIIGMALRELSDKLSELGHSLSYSENVVDYLLKEVGDNKNYGARPIARTISACIENEVADRIISAGAGKVSFTLTVSDGALVIESKSK